MESSTASAHIKILISIILIILGINQANGEIIEPAGMTLTIECDSIVNVDSIFPIKYIVSYKGKLSKGLNIDINSFDNNKVRFKPTVNNTSISISNMQYTSTVSQTGMLVISDIGRFEIPGCVVTMPSENAGHGRDTINFPPVHKYVHVVKDAQKTRESRGRCTKKPDANEAESPIFKLITCLDKDNICLGDSAVMKVKLQSNQEIRKCQFPGTTEIDDCYYEERKYGPSAPELVTIDGKDCNEWVIMEFVLIPLKTGCIKIPEIALEGEYSKFIFEGPAADTMRNIYFPFNVKSNPVTLKIKKK